ncbi:nuclear autoantigenic sperm [Pelobates cultripes]|uniref:Nuclear autoantigenic sperm n=1 Tax=Pelobates cultripes TaxID=61616 RepID=A0AAD1SS27_PELCU|nr:nuclear autoantigenic sperm [Pelobates cultripes]
MSGHVVHAQTMAARAREAGAGSEGKRKQVGVACRGRGVSPVGGYKRGFPARGITSCCHLSCANPVSELSAMAEETVSVPTESSKPEVVDAPTSSDKVAVPEAVDTPSTSSDKVAVEDVECEAKKLMGAGHRNLVMKDIKSAVAAFQEASSLLAKKYGDTADECADAFFSYGISLLELARMENGVLGNALEGIPEEEEEEDEKEDPNIPSAENIDDGEDSEENEETEEKENEEEDVGNLQLAWEMLDLSKIIFRRKETKEAQLKAAQAHLKLGEVSVESENYSQAVEDFLACLTIQQEHLEAHDRLLAETHYQLGLAYQYNCKHEDAISHFNKSINVIAGRITVLSGKMEAATEPDAEIQKEIEELKNLLPDIKEKIEDSKEAQKTAIATEIALKETLAGGSSGFSSKENGSTSTSTDKNSGDCTVPVQNCVSDISHLVRKKRKPEEESPLKDSEAKKAKPDLVENGDGSEDAVVPTNEEAEKAEEAGQIPMETAAVESSA